MQAQSCVWTHHGFGRRNGRFCSYVLFSALGLPLKWCAVVRPGLCPCSTCRQVGVGTKAKGSTTPYISSQQVLISIDINLPHHDVASQHRDTSMP